MQALGYMHFEELANRIKAQLFGDDGQGVSIVEHKELLIKYTELESKYDRLQKQANEVW